MNRFYALTFIFILLTSLLNAQSDKYETPSKLTHWMSAEEAAQKHLIGRNFTPTDPPPAPINCLAEFSPMKGALVRYPFGIPVSLIKEIAEAAQLTTIVADQSEENTVISIYQSNGVNMDNCLFLHAPTDSYWTRDFGPWFIIDGNDEVGIVDFPYNRPRPNDDNVPVFVANMMDVPLYGMDLIHTGGNWMNDGMGIGASTDLVWVENPTLSHDQVDDLVADYLGITNYHVVDDPNNTYIDHIDCWGKFLDVDKILIRAVPATHAQYADLENMAAYWAEQICSYGYPYNVVRVYTPGDQPYSNSLILNNKIYVPITNSQWDDDALQSYEDAMPGYQVFGFYGDWESTDALHCRTHEMADKEMLFIDHHPLFGSIAQGVPFDLTCTLKALSGEAFKTDSLLVFYQVNSGSWQTTALTSAGNDQFTATIPPANNGSTVKYYLYAADQSGRTVRHPYIGAYEPHMFTVGAPAYPTIVISPFSVNKNCLTGHTCGGQISVSNLGAVALNFTITIEEDAKEYKSFALANTPVANAWERNTYLEAKSSECLIESNADVKDIRLSFDYSVNDYPFENSIWLKAPSGKSIKIAKGLAAGAYELDIDDFKGESMHGRWSLWIEDNFGDGGAQMTQIELAFAANSQRNNWISVDPMSGTVDPEGNMSLDYTLDATDLTAGDYTGRIIFSSNDPQHSEVNLPVTLHVKEPSDLRLNPDTLWFLNRADIQDGKDFFIANRDLINHDILSMNHEGANEICSWAINPWTLDLPTFVMSRDSIELHIDVEALAEWPVVGDELVYDSIVMTSELSTQKLVLAMNPMALYQEVVVAPDTLFFLTEQDIQDGKTFSILNPAIDSMEILNLPFETENYLAFITNYPDEPNFWMQSGQENEYTVVINIPIGDEIVYDYDSLIIETENSFHKVYIKLDSDLIAGMAEQQNQQRLAVLPNPVRSNASIRVDISKNEYVSLDIYTNGGVLAAHVFDGMLSAGSHTFEYQLPASDLPNGMYFLMLETASGERSIQKLLIVR